MKNFWSWSAKILFVLLLVSIGYHYKQHHQYEALSLSYQQLEIELADTQKTLAESQQKSEELEKKSVEGLLRETNKVVVSGWETLLNAVEEELNKAREMIQQKTAPNPDEQKFEIEGSQEEPQEQAIPNTQTPAIINGERT